MNPDLVRLRLEIAYDGTAYQGWQAQKVGTGVQSLVEAALQRLFPGAGAVHGCSRTDTGVHARALIAHVDLPLPEWRMSARKLVLALNAHLPADIRLLAARRVPPEFHARFQATGKEYRYLIWNHAALHPLHRHQAWHVTRPLDLPAMKAAARHFVGRHDFAAFTVNPGYRRRSTVRTVTHCEVRRRGPAITVVIAGDGFLYKMCRSVVGTLVQVGMGKFAPDDLPALLAGRDRRATGMTAPAHGLVLWKVHYPRPGDETSPPAHPAEDAE